MRVAVELTWPELFFYLTAKARAENAAAPEVKNDNERLVAALLEQHEATGKKRFGLGDI